MFKSKFRLAPPFLFIILFMAFPSPAQKPDQNCAEQFRVGTIVQDCAPVSGKVYNMLDYMIPSQKWDDVDQYHFDGYMACAPVPWGEVCQNEPIYARGFYEKEYVETDDGDGNKRISACKSVTGLVGHPCEYYETRTERRAADDDEFPLTQLYLTAETLDWGGNQSYRAYHLPDGRPTLEIGRSQVREGEALFQDPKFALYEYCGTQPTHTYLMPIPGMGTVHFFTMEEGKLDELNTKLGNLGPVEPKWLDIARSLGQDKAELMIIVGNWGYAGVPLGPEPWRWRNQELYIYLKGVGWVSWRWQQHIENDLHAPFQTIKTGNVDTIVWEGADKSRNSALCETIPSPKKAELNGISWGEVPLSPHPRPEAFGMTGNR